MPQDQIEALQNLPPNQQFVELAKLAGFQDWAARAVFRRPRATSA